MKGLGDLTCTEEPVLDKKKRLLTHLYYHEPCAAYSGGMGAIPTTIMDVEEDVIKEWQRGSVRPELPGFNDYPPQNHQHWPFPVSNGCLRVYISFAGGAED